MERDGKDFTALLPEDLLTDVLRRFPPRGLAASRRVCTAWRAAVDGRRLLHAAELLLPRSLAGLFVSYNELLHSEFFARPSVGLESLDGFYLPYNKVVDHCNGLLLHYHCVLNPATGELARLPKRPPQLEAMERFIEEEYLVFDPTVSSHYEVFSVPSVYERAFRDDEFDPETHPYADRSVISNLKELPFYKCKIEQGDSLTLQSEWPPSSWNLCVFSSRTGKWEERSFIREGEAAGTVADMLPDERLWPHRHAEYWRGALYVHCQNDFVARISLSNSTYRVIKPPSGIEKFEYPELHIGRSEKGVCYALLDKESNLQVWILDDQLQWELKHDSRRKVALRSLCCDQNVHRPWILENADCDESETDDDQASGEQEFEWNSDDDFVANIEHKVEKHQAHVWFLAFHPYKDIVFLQRSRRGLAYHLSSSKLEDLGNLYPEDYFRITDTRGCITDAVSYTPCWIGELPNAEGLTED